MPITTKQQMYRMWQSGLLGNRLRGWRSVGQMQAEGYTGLVGVRSTNVSGFKLAAVDNVPAADIPALLEEHGIPETNIMLGEGAPDERLLLQGEVMREPGGLYVRFSCQKAKMRVAMLNAVQVRGLWADHLLRRNLTPASYDDIMELLDLHDGVVEFSAYATLVGGCPGRNCVIWEVRSY